MANNQGQNQGKSGNGGNSDGERGFAAMSDREQREISKKGAASF